jgi:hypothetical protein|tara:strand:+ start:550 stop:765 length:216 start_codon:yes stop_codon:yes gene_type:complete
MSKMGNLRIEAEESVEYYSKADFVRIFGSGSNEIWEEHNGGDHPSSEDPSNYKMTQEKYEKINNIIQRVKK